MSADPHLPETMSADPRLPAAVYLDSSALVKLVVAEPESPALRRYLRRRATRVSCALARVEVVRAVRPQGSEVVARAGRVLARVRLLRLDEGLLEAAASIDSAVLRSLDAIHLAAAWSFGDSLGSLVTYDVRLREAAEQVGLAVAAPA